MTVLAFHDHDESLAMVLFYEDLFQLFRDDIDYHGIVLLALEYNIRYNLRTRM